MNKTRDAERFEEEAEKYKERAKEYKTDLTQCQQVKIINNKNTKMSVDCCQCCVFILFCVKHCLFLLSGFARCVG